MLDNLDLLLGMFLGIICYHTVYSIFIRKFFDDKITEIAKLLGESQTENIYLHDLSKRQENLLNIYRNKREN